MASSRRISKETQRELLRDLRDLGYGQAESEPDDMFACRFHPVPEHLRAFDPDVVLVVGARGSGKSALFRAVFSSGMLLALARHAPNVRFPNANTEKIEWITGYPLGADFPDARGLRETVRTPENAADLWFAYLVRRLGDQFSADQKETLGPILEPRGGNAEAVLTAFHGLGTSPTLILDELDARLQQDDRWVFVGYDELDTLGGYDWDLMARSVRGLVSFWSAYTRRWRRLRAKIFLRTDLFRRHAGIGGADLAKLAANRAELQWTDANLFAVLLKRMANTSERLVSYCRGARIHFREDPDLGWIPRIDSAEAARPLIERMVGPYMGANRRKGLTHRWLLDHLRDGLGNVAPRSLVRLFEQAAQKEAANLRVSPPKLLHPTSLRQALEDVSNDHVIQGVSNEWPWLAGVNKRIQSEVLVPWERKKLQALLQQSWGEPWGQGDDIRSPAGSASELTDYLVELGIFRKRKESRVDVPDIYLFGLGLRRKGGVRRK